MSKTTTGFPFDKIDALVANGFQDSANDVVFECIDDMLLAGDFEGVDAVLAEAPLDGLTPAVALGYLTITHAAAQHLPGRPAFVDRVRPWLVAKIGAERTAALLSTRG